MTSYRIYVGEVDNWPETAESIEFLDTLRDAKLFAAGVAATSESDRTVLIVSTDGETWAEDDGIDEDTNLSPRFMPHDGITEDDAVWMKRKRY